MAAESERLLHLLGINAVVEITAPATASPPSSAPVLLRIKFALTRAGSLAPPAVATIALANNAGAHAEDLEADFLCDNAIAAACFILSKALGLASFMLTSDERLFEKIRAAILLAQGPARVLVEGEIGVGKESLIKLIHAASGDSMSLIHAECAGLEATRVAAEVIPLLAQAAGTIFFNRIEELSLVAQSRLLELIRASSSSSTASPDSQRVRYLAASTRSLAAMVARGEFLAELNGLFDATLILAPLRDRSGDLPMLVRYFLRKLNPDAHAERSRTACTLALSISRQPP